MVEGRSAPQAIKLKHDSTNTDLPTLCPEVTIQTRYSVLEVMILTRSVWFLFDYGVALVGCAVALMSIDVLIIYEQPCRYMNMNGSNEYYEPL